MKPIVARILLAFTLACATCAQAAPTIELADGSRIQGDVKGLHDGVYTIVSPTLGTVHIAEANIVRIVYGGRSDGSAPIAVAPSNNAALASQALQLQAQIAADPADMQAILGLQNDPQILAILSDPQIVQAIERGDYAGLINNPKIQALENNAHLKQVLQQLLQQQ